jgi:hypothetical protein
MTRLLCVCALVAWLSCACDVATVAQVPSNVAQNQCTGDSDCPGGSCVGGQCESHEGTLQTVLLAVTPPTGTSASADLQFLRQADLPSAGGDWDLPLDAVAQVVGDVKLFPPRTCTTSFDNNGMMLASSGDHSVPGTISLTPSQKQLGVFSQSAVAQTILINTSSFSFSMNVPPGDYDIYYQPQHQLNDNCIVSPQLLRNQPITPNLKGLHLTLPESSSFEFHVNWPAGDGALNGWTADMLDPVSGHVISNRAQLALGTISKMDYVATIYYLPVIGDTSDQMAQELVRLSPPDCVTPPDCVIAPTILLSRSALGLFDANKGTLSDFTTLPTKVHIHGQVTAAATPKPVAATVTLVATSIIGIQPGVLASFVRTVTTGVNGQFDLDVLPGSYRVTAVPSAQLDTETNSSDDSKLAEVSDDWSIADSPDNQAGKVIGLSTALPINGAAFNASGSTAVVTALVQAVASTSSTKVDVLHQALGEVVVVPRAATARVESGGDFSLIADPGTFDVSVRPLAASGFSWLVVPSVAVGTTAPTSAGVNLMSRALPLPVVYRGTVTLAGAGTAPTATVPGALIRAFVYTSAGQYTSEPAKADAVVQVAESRADTKGGFTLLIPATLNGAVR